MEMEDEEVKVEEEREGEEEEEEDHTRGLLQLLAHYSGSCCDALRVPGPLLR